LSNNNMAIALRVNMVAARRLAAMTDDPRDVKDAAEAERMYDEHMQKQAVVDASAGEQGTSGSQ
jgi:hypothetical protein